MDRRALLNLARTHGKVTGSERALQWQRWNSFGSVVEIT
jgi:hypothetical protein